MSTASPLSKDDAVPHIIEDRKLSPAQRKSWARLIQKVYEVDPLYCPKCRGAMEVIAFFKQPDIVKKISNPDFAVGIVAMGTG